MPPVDLFTLIRAAEMALDYLDSPNFPHKSPAGHDWKPAVAALRAALFGDLPSKKEEK